MTEDQSTLSVLEALSEAADLPQRGIAERTGLNLAKVNFVLRALVDKGYVKLKRVKANPHKRRYLYLLTPEGVSAKSRLAYHFVQRTLRQYAAVEDRVAESVERMAARGVRRVVLWGATEITELCLRVLKRSDAPLKVVGVIDPSGRHPQALSVEQLAAVAPDAVIVCEPEAAGLPAGLEAHWLV